MLTFYGLTEERLFRHVRLNRMNQNIGSSGRSRGSAGCESPLSGAKVLPGSGAELLRDARCGFADHLHQLHQSQIQHPCPGPGLRGSARGSCQPPPGVWSSMWCRNTIGSCRVIEHLRLIKDFFAEIRTQTGRGC